MASLPICYPIPYQGRAVDGRVSAEEILVRATTAEFDLYTPVVVAYSTCEDSDLYTPASAPLEAQLWGSHEAKS